eukprot:scaffold1310_cov219-Ochromonas_danica.AAC.2
MSVIWQLPGDILHSVYSEWLGWKDVSRLDVACVGKSDREVWLTSLTNLHINDKTIIKGRISADQLSQLYLFLTSRKVYIKGFPVRLDVLSSLIKHNGMMTPSYCPGLHSIIIIGGRLYESMPTTNTTTTSSHYCEVEQHLSVFLSHCHSLQEVTVRLDDQYVNELSKYLSEIVLGVLEQTLRENSLIKMDLQGNQKSPNTSPINTNPTPNSNLTTNPNAAHPNPDPNTNNPNTTPNPTYPDSTNATNLTNLNSNSNATSNTNLMIANLLTKHASSIQELHLSIKEEGMDVIISSLLENEIHLKVLIVNVSLGSTLCLVESWLLPYLSSGGGMLLEVLEVNTCREGLVNIDQCLGSLARSCPKLTQLIIPYTNHVCHIENLRLLYEYCPSLHYVTIDRMIEIDKENRSISMIVRKRRRCGSNDNDDDDDGDDDWVVCLCYALRRCRYKQVRLTVQDDSDYHHYHYYQDHPVPRQSNSLQSSHHVSRTESRVSLKDSFSPNSMKDPERYYSLGGRQSPSESAAAAVPPRHDHCKIFASGMVGVEPKETFLSNGHYVLEFPDIIHHNMIGRDFDHVRPCGSTLNCGITLLNDMVKISYLFLLLLLFYHRVNHCSDMSSLAKSIVKGQMIYGAGHLVQSKWTDKQTGEEKKKFRMRVTSILTKEDMEKLMELFDSEDLFTFSNTLLTEKVIEKEKEKTESRVDKDTNIGMTTRDIVDEIVKVDDSKRLWARNSLLSSPSSDISTTSMQTSLTSEPIRPQVISSKEIENATTKTEKIEIETNEQNNSWATVEAELPE